MTRCLLVQCRPGVIALLLHTTVHAPSPWVRAVCTIGISIGIGVYPRGVHWCVHVQGSTAAYTRHLGLLMPPELGVAMASRTTFLVMPQYAMSLQVIVAERVLSVLLGFPPCVCV